jgi:signal transduction histidine kinase
MEGRLRKPLEDTQPVLQKLSDLIELNSSIIVQVRNIARDLRPVVLDQVGLSAGIETLVRDFNRREHTFCGLHISELPDLTESLRTDLFRIVQEGLTNISRHAEAKLAYVRLSHINDSLILEMGDDGNGMTQQFNSGDFSTGLGLVGMRERVRAQKGTMSVNSSLKRGTSIQIDIALNSPA